MKSILGLVAIEDIRSTITVAFTSRSLKIMPDSELSYLLEEVQKFESSTRDQTAGKTGSETDERAVLVGATLLYAQRLATSIAHLAKERVPHITETLKTLGSFKHGNSEHELQFEESEYELHMASQFVGFGQRVSFVKAASASRYKQRVEFMLGYKWPVECKRPRSKGQILSNIDKAIAKIAERSQPGLVCLGLESAFPQAGLFLEAADSSDICAQVSSQLRPWLSKNRDAIQGRLSKSDARFLIFTYVVRRSYMHDTEHVALPSLRLGLSSSGDWITTDVAETCIEALKTERASK
jgi:hypothetical protein